MTVEPHHLAAHPLPDRTREQATALPDPADYLGVAAELVDRALRRYEEERR